MYKVHTTVLVRLNSLDNLQIYFIIYFVILLFIFIIIYYDCIDFKSNMYFKIIKNKKIFN